MMTPEPSPGPTTWWRRAPAIGPRWLMWGLLLFGAAEIPWVLYLAFFQQRTATAYHVRLAALGIATVTIMLCVLAAIMLLRRRLIGAHFSVAAATAMTGGAVLVALAPTFDYASALDFAIGPVAVAVPGVAAAGIGAVATLTGRWDSDRTRIVIAAVLMLVAAALAAHLWRTVHADLTQVDASHLRLLVVLLDTSEVVALLGAGLALRHGSARWAVVFASMGLVLFPGDAWTNIVFVGPGPQFVAAIFYAVVGEGPSTVMCAYAVVLATRTLTAQRAAGKPATARVAT